MMSPETMEETFKAMLGALNRIEHLLQDQQTPFETKDIKEASQQVEGLAEQEDVESIDDREPGNGNDFTSESDSEKMESEPGTEARRICNVSNIVEFKEVVRGGSRIPSDGRLTLFFTQNYLESIELNEARRKLAELSTLKKMLDSRVLDEEKRKFTLLSSGQNLEGWGDGPGIRFGIMDFNLNTSIGPLDDDGPEYVPSSEGRNLPVQYYRSPYAVPDMAKGSWGRIILWQGVSQMAACLGKKCVKPHVICPLLFGNIRPSPVVNETSMFDMVPWDIFNEANMEEVIEQHISCRKSELISEAAAYDSGTSTLFRTTFFELSDQASHLKSANSGVLYSRDAHKRHWFRKECLTIVVSRNGFGVAAQDSSSRKTKSLFTILVLAPQYFFSQVNQASPIPVAYKTMMYPTHPFDDSEDAKLRLISQTAEILVEKWKALFRVVLQECDNEDISFLDPDKFIHLLYDDSTFQRSRFYFWVIACLTSFEQSIADTLSDIAICKAEVLKDKELGYPVRMSGYYNEEKTFRKYSNFIDFKNKEGQKWKDNIWKKSEAELKRLDANCAGLEQIQLQMQKKREEIRSLRDGLFSASGVMETRQSRILGENVQLLTFVSIFFLPLAFCISLWSVPDINATYPGIATPISVAAIMGLVTYLTVFNLNLIISRVQAVASGPKQYLLDRMAEEKPKVNEERGSSEPAESPADWPTTAKRFEVFPQKDKTPKPSNWWIVVFALYLLSQKALSLHKGGLKIMSSKFHRAVAEEKEAKPQRNDDIEMGQAGSTSAGVVGMESGVVETTEVIEKD